MPFSSVNPDGNGERFTRGDLTGPVLVKAQYTPVRFDVEVPVVNGPILKPLAAMLAPYQRLVHPEAL